MSATEAAPRQYKTKHRGTDRELSPDGSKTVSQMMREHDEFMDGQPMVTRCTIEGCDWHHDGTVAEGRELAAAHREKSHPVLPGDRRRAEEREAARQARRQAAERRAAPGAAGKATPAQPAENKGGRKVRWPKERVLESLKRFVEENGRVPTQADWKRSSEHYPVWGTAARAFGGSWTRAKEAASQFIPADAVPTPAAPFASRRDDGPVPAAHPKLDDAPGELDADPSAEALSIIDISSWPGLDERRIELPGREQDPEGVGARLPGGAEDDDSLPDAAGTREPADGPVGADPPAPPCQHCLDDLDETELAALAQALAGVAGGLRQLARGPSRRRVADIVRWALDRHVRE